MISVLEVMFGFVMGFWLPLAAIVWAYYKWQLDTKPDASEEDSIPTRKLIDNIIDIRTRGNASVGFEAALRDGDQKRMIEIRSKVLRILIEQKAKGLT